MVHIASAPSLLETLPARPPTPPRDSFAGRSSLSAIEDCSNLATPIFASSWPRAIDTPPDDSPSSSADAARTASGKSQKRVEWSPWTNYHQAPSTINPRRPSVDSQLKPLPPSRERKCSKSILKPYDNSLLPASSRSPDQPALSVTAHATDNRANMLESALQELAGENRSGRSDAYMTLAGALKYLDDVPNSKQVGDNMALITHFIRRDLNAKVPGKDVLDTPLIILALKVLTIFILTPQLSDGLTDEFRSYVLDHAISILENGQTPKALIRHHMHLLGQQKFGSKVLTADRANRIVSSLTKLEDHVKGNGVSGERLVIYQRLLCQAKHVMAARAHEWMPHLFSGLLSGMREIRSRAIAFGTQAGIDLGTTPHPARVLKEFFNKSYGQARFVDHVRKHLDGMIAAKDEASHVAQIWSVVILFLRSRPHQLEHWEHMKPWLLIIQKCFNSSDMMTKWQANIAWNRLVFAINPDLSTGQTMIKMLRQPMIGQLERKTHDKLPNQARQMALASLCGLLYYSLRPTATFKQLDLYWDQYVAQVVGKSVLPSHADADHGCLVLAGLFDVTQAKLWNENRANESGTIKPEELPRLDSKWVRLNCQMLLNTLETALSTATWSTVTDKVSAVRQMWLNLCKTLADAGSKEVLVSQERMGAVAHILNLFQRTWKTGPTALGVVPNGSLDFVDRFGFLVQSSLESLGAHCFTEKLLLLDSDGTFEALPTSLHRSSRHALGQLRSPAVHLVQLLALPAANIDSGPLTFGLAKSILETCCRSRGSHRTQLEFLRECADALPSNASSPTSLGLWRLIAELATSSMKEAGRSAAVNTSDTAGREYQDAVSILAHQCHMYNQELGEAWHGLFGVTADSAKQSLDMDTPLVAVIGPLSNAIWQASRTDWNPALLNPACQIVSRSAFTKHHQPPDVRKKPRGAESNNLKPATLDASAKLYGMINSLLQTSYDTLSTSEDGELQTFLKQVGAFIARCPSSQSAVLLGKLQDGIGLWVEDADHKMSCKDGSLREVFVTSMDLWAAVATAVEQLPFKNSETLRNMARLLTAGLQSRRKVVVNRTIELWNSTFGAETTLEYPATVKYALLRLRGVDSLRLPTFPTIADDEVVESSLAFLDSSEDDVGLFDDVPWARLNYIQSTFPSLRQKSRLATSSSPARPSSAKKSPRSSASAKDQTPKSSVKRKGQDKKLTPRLRHDDSQIRFAAIESSPLDASAMDSRLLTDRQREVRQRQQGEAANMFPDLRYSPRPKSDQAKAALPRLALSSDLPSTGELIVDGATTPTLPPPSHGPMDFFIASSPTPRPNHGDEGNGQSDHVAPPSSSPNRAAVLIRSSLEDPPSSPPATADPSTLEPQQQPAFEVFVDALSSPMRASPDVGLDAEVPHDTQQPPETTHNAGQCVRLATPDHDQAYHSTLDKIDVDDGADATIKTKIGQPTHVAETSEGDARKGHPTAAIGDEVQAQTLLSQSAHISADPEGVPPESNIIGALKRKRAFSALSKMPKRTRGRPRKKSNQDDSLDCVITRVTDRSAATPGELQLSPTGPQSSPLQDMQIPAPSTRPRRAGRKTEKAIVNIEQHKPDLKSGSRKRSAAEAAVELLEEKTEPAEKGAKPRARKGPAKKRTSLRLSQSAESDAVSLVAPVEVDGIPNAENDSKETSQAQDGPEVESTEISPPNVESEGQQLENFQSGQAEPPKAAQNTSIPLVAVPSPTTGPMTARNILNLLNRVLEDVKDVGFDIQELRSMDDVMFEIRRAAFQSERGSQ